MTQTSYPRRMQHHLATQSIGDEMLVYDERRHLAFYLDPVASAVWRQCDGTHSIAEVAAGDPANPLPEELVVAALAQLERDLLLQSSAISYAQLGVLSRRSLIEKFGASAFLLLPVVAMVAAPTAAHAYNGCADCDAVGQQGQGLQRYAIQQRSAAPATVPGAPSIFKP